MIVAAMHIVTGVAIPALAHWFAARCTEHDRNRCSDYL